MLCHISGSSAYKNAVFNGEQEKESILIFVCGCGGKILSLVMPNGDSRDGCFYTTLTLMIDLYDPTLISNQTGIKFNFFYCLLKVVSDYFYNLLN